MLRHRRDLQGDQVFQDIKHADDVIKLHEEEGRNLVAEVDFSGCEDSVRGVDDPYLEREGDGHC